MLRRLLGIQIHLNWLSRNEIGGTPMNWANTIRKINTNI